eukprot:5678563-Pleurochrysis_carterae.AAC.1
MPIVIDDADSTVSMSAQIPQTAPSPTKYGTTNREAGDLSAAPAGGAPDGSAQPAATFQRIDRHRHTWPM